MDKQTRKQVVIVGGGFGGLHAAKALRRANVDVTLVDRRNFHLFQPLLYQVATGGLSPANIASPIRSILRRQKNTNVMLGEVVAVDPIAKSIDVNSDEPGESKTQVETLFFDWLIVAAGATTSYFGHDEWERLAPGLKKIEEATEIRGRIFSAFEAAEYETDTPTHPIRYLYSRQAYRVAASFLERPFLDWSTHLVRLPAYFQHGPSRNLVAGTGWKLSKT